MLPHCCRLQEVSISSCLDVLHESFVYTVQTYANDNMYSNFCHYCLSDGSNGPIVSKSSCSTGFVTIHLENSFVFFAVAFALKHVLYGAILSFSLLDSIVSHYLVKDALSHVCHLVMCLIEKTHSFKCYHSMTKS